MARTKQGSICRRQNRIYARIRWTEIVDGRRVSKEKFARVRTVSEGREKIKQLLHDLEDQGPKTFDADRMTFSDLAGHYAAAVIRPAEYSGDRKIGGLRNTSSPANQLKASVNYFGDRLIKSIDYSDLQEFKIARANRITRRQAQPSIVTVNRELERLHACFEYAVRRQWLRRNPFDNGAPLINKADEPIRETIPTADEVRAILAQCRGPRSHIKPILLMIKDTGMRPSEMFRLKLQNLDLKVGTVEVTVKNSKTGKRRIVGLTRELQAELLAVIDAGELQPGDLLFGITNNIRRSYATACRLAGVQGITLYSWRHLCATEMIRAQIPQALAMKQLGHTEEKTFRRYITVDQELATQAVEALEAYRKQNKK